MNPKIKDALGAILMLTLLAFAFSSVKYVKTFDRSSEPTSFRSFSVSGEGKIVAVPDVAQFSFSVITEGGTDVASLQKKNTEKINEAIKYLKDSDIDDKDIKTQSYNIQPRYTYFPCRGDGPCAPPQIDGYSITQSVQVKARDFDTVGTLLAGVVGKGANSVTQLNFTIDDRTEVENDARAEAIQKAQAKGKDIAKAGGFKLGRLLTISESGSSRPPVAPYGIGFGGASDARAEFALAPEIEPGSQDVSINVTLTYEIE